MEPGGSGDEGSSTIGSQEISGTVKRAIVRPGACSVRSATVKPEMSDALRMPSWSALLDKSRRFGSVGCGPPAAGWSEKTNSAEVGLVQVTVLVSWPRSCCCRDTMSLAGRLEA